MQDEDRGLRNDEQYRTAVAELNGTLNKAGRPPVDIVADRETCYACGITFALRYRGSGTRLGNLFAQKWYLCDLCLNVNRAKVLREGKLRIVNKEGEGNENHVQGPISKHSKRAIPKTTERVYHSAEARHFWQRANRRQGDLLN